MRTAAKVCERTLCICRDMSVFKFADEFALVFFASIAKEFECIFFGDIGTLDFFFALCEFQHFLFNFTKVRSCDLVFTRVNVVIEPVFNSRTDTEFHARIQFLERFGKEVSGTVPESVFAFRIIPFEKFNAAITFQRTR